MTSTDVVVWPGPALLFNTGQWGTGAPAPFPPMHRVKNRSIGDVAVCRECLCDYPCPTRTVLAHLCRADRSDQTTLE